MSAAGRPSAETDRLHSALHAHIRQEFLAPAAAIVGFTEILLEDTAKLGLPAYRTDLERIHSAGRDLEKILKDTLAQTAGPGDVAAYRAKLRHDLRTPINAIKGYGEMIVEDATDGSHDVLIADLRNLLTAAEGMLARIDALVTFTDTENVVPSAHDGVAQVIRTMKAFDSAVVTGTVTGRILIIDDNASNRDLLARQLARDGHAVETDDDGATALARLAWENFDLILLDLLMPNMSGYEVLGRLKDTPQTHDVPVIMISALDELDSIVRCIEAGAVDYLPKPFDPTLLRARIRASLENKLLRDRERAMTEELKTAHARNEALLLNILPRPVVDRINAGEVMIADYISETTILFADIVGFTPLSGTMPATDLVRLLNRIFSTFDRLAEHFGAEKIKTIGDAYMVALGLPEPRGDHAEAGARMALAMIASLPEIHGVEGVSIGFRIGLHTGPVVAGVIGERKFAYDVWGSTVNIASRMESHGAKNCVHISRALADRLRGKFALTARGPINVRGAGLMETFFLGKELG